MKRKGLLRVLLALFLTLTIIGVYFTYTKNLPFLFKNQEFKFDPDKHLKIVIVDSVTNKGVEGVPIHFFNDCPVHADINDPTCGGKYEEVADGMTDSKGELIIIKSEDTPPPGVLHFQLGDKLGYNTDIGTCTFIFEGGVSKSEVVYKIIPLSAGSGALVSNPDSAIAVVEADENFMLWKSYMERIEKFNVDVRGGVWRVNYQGYNNNTADSLISFYVDPKTGEVIYYEEKVRRVLPPYDETLQD